jgi:hypothetical protein
MLNNDECVTQTPHLAGTYKLRIGHFLKDRTKAYPVVCVYDPAINREHSDLKAYAGDIDAKGLVLSRGDRDISKLVFNEGMKPTIYYIKCLPTDVAINIRSLSHASGWMSFFDLGVVRVENLLGTNGVEYPIFEPIKSYTTAKGSTSCIGDDIGIFPASDVMEIADVVEQRSFLHPKSEPKFQLLPTSKRLLDF